MGKILSVITAFALLVLACACNTNGCLENQSSIPLAGFYAMNTKQPVTVSKMLIGGVDAPNDSLLLSNGSAAEVYLPFRATSNVTSFYFHLVTDADSTGIDTRYNDTITFHYNSIPYFASSDCGAIFRYEITEYSHTSLFIDSVAVIDSLITNVDIQRIHIYFHNDDSDSETDTSTDRRQNL